MKRPSPALVVSFVALFVSLGGTSFAVTRYVITSEQQIKPSVLRQLVQAKQSSGAAVQPPLTGPAGSVGVAGPAGSPGAQGAAGTPGTPGLEGKQGERGEAGPRGESGATGATGERGPEGKLALSVTVRSLTYTLASNQGGALPARCEPGEIATGGGYQMLKGSSVGVTGSVPATTEPNAPPVNWDVWWQSQPGESEIRVYAVCQR